MLAGVLQCYTCESNAGPRRVASGWWGGNGVCGTTASDATRGAGGHSLEDGQVCVWSVHAVRCVGGGDPMSGEGRERQRDRDKGEWTRETRTMRVT